MQIQIDFWQLLVALAGLIGAFVAVAKWLGSLIVGQFEKRLDERFKTINESVDIKSDEFKKFERDFLTFQRDMPLQYVRRDDYIRGQTVIESKIDAVMSKLELVQLQGARNDR
jgi:LPS O-antigen subunit length determinant protein (WzzB/FepE family)